MLPPGAPDDVLAQDDAGHLLTANTRTFSLAARLLTPRTREAATVCYAFCRIADDIVDTRDPHDPAAARALLARWEDQIEAPVQNVAVRFAEMRRARNIPDEPVRDLFAGLRQDLDFTGFETWLDLRQYCYRVAGTVGLMMARVLGCDDDRAFGPAVELGIAMQLTNILRDIADDARMGRIYLPREDLVRFGVCERAILDGHASGDVPGLMRFEIERARALYRSSRAGIPYLPGSSQFATVAMSTWYASILDQIERQGLDPWAGRARVSFGGKLATMPRVVGIFVRGQMRSGRQVRNV